MDMQSRQPISQCQDRIVLGRVFRPEQIGVSGIPTCREQGICDSVNQFPEIFAVPQVIRISIIADVSDQHTHTVMIYVDIPPEKKYMIIQEMTRRDNNLLSITALCDIAGVSRSGYYRWYAEEPKRIQREARDKADFELILAAYQHRGYAKGARGLSKQDNCVLFLCPVPPSGGMALLSFRLTAFAF